MIHTHREFRRAAFTLGLSLLSLTVSACGNDAAVDATSRNASQPADRSLPPTYSADSAVVSDTTTDKAESPMASSPAMPSSLTGTLEPQARALLRAELSGAVRTLSAKVGQRVTAGQVLAVLDVPALHSALAAAEAQVIAQDVALRQARREYDRVAQLLKIGGVSSAEMEEWESRVQAADAAVNAARAQRANAAAEVQRLTVRAPFDGIVERQTTTQGSVVQAGDELVSIIDPRLLELGAGVAAADAFQARPGARVALRVTGVADSAIVARIVRVSPALDPVTRQLRVTVLVPNADGRIPAGAWAEGTLLNTTNTRRHTSGGH
ncbi:efflux RND transporter periplasmic adaptor subunit [Gemmatimonas sp.]|jgi:membrane fusion protein (multidrug efflux system)|uniref:efflux RND transporter periplasmic adaptor subunit n=1 Tax=Gemmatimonas sp. TaxID=1962908 RepID=UPI0037BECA57